MRAYRIVIVVLVLVVVLQAVALSVTLSPQAEEPTQTPFPVYGTCSVMVLGEYPDGNFGLWRLIKQGVVANDPEKYKCVYRSVETH